MQQFDVLRYNLLRVFVLPKMIEKYEKDVGK